MTVQSGLDVVVKVLVVAMLAAVAVLTFWPQESTSRAQVQIAPAAASCERTKEAFLAGMEDYVNGRRTLPVGVYLSSSLPQAGQFLYESSNGLFARLIAVGAPGSWIIWSHSAVCT